jgi:hypothetical protein
MWRCSHTSCRWVGGGWVWVGGWVGVCCWGEVCAWVGGGPVVRRQQHSSIQHQPAPTDARLHSCPHPPKKVALDAAFASPVAGHFDVLLGNTDVIFLEGLKKATLHYARLRALDLAGNVSPWSSVVSFTPA